MHFPRRDRKSSVEGEKEKESVDTSRPTLHTSPPSPVLEPITTPAPTHPQQSQNARPGLQHRRTTARTRYIDMLLGLDNVPRLHNILAAACVWILLAGYIVFPATFNSLSKSSLDDKADTALKAQALATARNVPLLYVAAAACGVGVLGIFLPSLLNSVAGLVSTLVNVYSAQEGQFSVTAKVTVVVTSACAVVAAALFLLYNTVMLNLVKRRHEREVRAEERNGETRSV
ncbi:hypothetical protein OPT61_g8262 [Boeremia exigua]|uniref:Uncharacterized protein n=1 Tax=Boeremia exigua TaxID=749465 RepID=A0ACC2HZ13_9PLEO|nr:hypothetical protein OPT61_g8262 [Boeremia exigua]